MYVDILLEKTKKNYWYTKKKKKKSVLDAEAPILIGH